MRIVKIELASLAILWDIFGDFQTLWYKYRQKKSNWTWQAYCVGVFYHDQSNRQKFYCLSMIIRLLMNYLITGITILRFCCTVGILSRNTLRPPDGSSQWITWYIPSCTLTMHSRQWGKNVSPFSLIFVYYTILYKRAGNSNSQFLENIFSLPVNSREFLWFWVKFMKSRIYKIIQETKMS